MSTCLLWGLTGCALLPSGSEPTTGQPGFTPSAHETRFHRDMAPDTLTSLDVLYDSSPVLYELYMAYPELEPALRQYAWQQGYTGAVERTATVVHELIHVASVTNRGFWVAGKVYRPFHITPTGASDGPWGGVSFADIHDGLASDETSMPLYRNYVKRNPDNGIANLLDEINASTQAGRFVCEQADRRQCQKQINLVDQNLAFFNAMIRHLTRHDPDAIPALRDKAGDVIDFLLLRAMALNTFAQNAHGITPRHRRAANMSAPSAEQGVD